MLHFNFNSTLMCILKINIQIYNYTRYFEMHTNSNTVHIHYRDLRIPVHV